MLIEIIGLLIIVALLGTFCFILGMLHWSVGIAAAALFTWGIYDLLKSTGSI